MAKTLRFLALLPLLAALPLAGCSLAPGPRLIAVEVERALEPDSLREMKTMWAEAPPLRIELRPPGASSGPGWPLELRAVHDGRALALLVVWPDRTEPGENRVEWVWSDRGRAYFRRENPTDMFAIKFPLSGSRDACMMTGAEGVCDVWRWRSGWSDRTGFADDLRLILSRASPSVGSPRLYPLSGPDDLMYVTWVDDSGDPPYAFVPAPEKRRGALVSAVEPSPPTGSAGDVKANGLWQSGEWSLELHRLLDTGSDEDYVFAGRGPHPFAVAISDGRGGQDHYTSELLRLVLK